MKLIDLLGLAAVAGGSVLLAWYHRLRPDEQAAADRIAGQYARALFGGKRIDQLTAAQGRQVIEATRHLFASREEGER